MSRDEVKNKLRTLYQGQKTDRVIDLVASTFEALAKEADFSDYQAEVNHASDSPSQIYPDGREEVISTAPRAKSVQFGSLTYQINIILPSTRDQSVYDAIFRSLREHLG